MKILISSMILVLAGCGGSASPTRDLSEHFWKYVNGDYASSSNGYYLSLNAKSRDATWYKPLTVAGGKPGEVCYLSVHATIESVTNGTPGLFGETSTPSLTAKATNARFDLLYVGAANVSQRNECEDIYDYNSAVSVNPIYIPVLGYGPDYLNVGQPQVCFIACENASSLSNQDFSKQAPGVYRHAARPF